MKIPDFFLRCCVALFFSTVILRADNPPVPSYNILQKSYEAPPGPPPTQGPAGKQKQAVAKQPSATAEGAQYLIGDPSDEEQLILELINRSRADANAEAQRYLNILQNNLDADIVSSVNFFAQSLITGVPEAERFNTFLTALVDQFMDLEKTLPPLSFNSDLIDAARFHSDDMFQNVFQAHNGSSGRNTFDRIEFFGYPRTGSRAENIFAFSESAEDAHAGLDIDWGTSGTTGMNLNGMQDPPGHRSSIHSSNFTEIGVGVTLGVNSKEGANPVGPFIITEDFGSRSDITPFITGVGLL